jgi:DNA-binding beta-propeller fold protein YncE
MSATLCLVALAAATLPADLDAPRARIDFPLPGALTDAETIRVRGSASDPDGVAAVRVNGVPASTTDGFDTWWAEVGLEIGVNELVVETVDALGHLDPAAAKGTVRRDEVIVADPRSVTVDATGGRIWISDSEFKPKTVASNLRVLSVDVDGSAVGIVSSSSVGVGPLPKGGSIHFDPHSGGALCVDSTNRLFRIDLWTGDRTVVSGQGVGTGTQFNNPRALAVDPLTPRAWVAQSGGFQDHGAVIETDLITGNRKVISTHNLGSGPWPTAPIGISVVPGSLRGILVFDECCWWEPNGHALIGLDLEQGHRAWITDGPVTPTSPWQDPASLLALDSTTAFVGDFAFLNGVFGVDLSSGTARRVSAKTHPAGPLSQVSGLAWNPAIQRLNVVDAYRSAVLDMNPADGSFELLFRSQLGEGETLSKWVKAIAVDPRASDRAIALDGEALDGQTGQTGRVIAIDLLNGRRSVLSGPSKGNGPIWGVAQDLVLDPVSKEQRAFVLGQSPAAVFEVDLATGDRTLVTSSDLGRGEPMIHPWFLDYEPTTDKLLVLDATFIFRYRILEIDPHSGDRSILSDPDHGAGPEIDSPGGISVDSEGHRLLVVSENRLLEIDLSTGDRLELSGPAAGAGPGLPFVGPVLWDPVERRALVQGKGGFIKGLYAVDGATGDRAAVAAFEESAGPGRLSMFDFAVARWQPNETPLLLLVDNTLAAVVVADLWNEPGETRNPGWRAIVSR